MLKYLDGTKHMKLKLTVENLSIIKWWIDSSYNVHWDARGHNGAMMTMRKGAIISNSNKQKLNIGSSTESELVATHDQMPDVMHTLPCISLKLRAMQLIKMSFTKTTNPPSG